MKNKFYLKVLEIIICIIKVMIVNVMVWINIYFENLRLIKFYFEYLISLIVYVKFFKFNGCYLKCEYIDF